MTGTEPRNYLAAGPGGMPACLADVGNRIREAREHIRIEQRILGRRAGVTQVAVSRWEAGRRDPGVAALIVIAEALGVRASALLPAGHQEPSGGFAAGTGERDACELLMDRAQDDLAWARKQLDVMADALRESQRAAAAAARLERDRIRALAVTHGALCVCRCGLEDLPDPKPGHQRMFAELLAEPEPEPGDAEIGASLRETLSAGVVIGPPELNNGRPSVWSAACAPGGMVCAVPDATRPDGICGNPVESEPCNRHEGQADVTGEPLTHFFHCWRFPDHHRCAVALIERQSEENDELLARAAPLERAAREAPGEPKSAPEGEGIPDA